MDALVLEAQGANVPVGGTLEIRAVLLDPQGTELGTREVEWRSGDPSVAAVSGGRVRGVAPGVATIVAGSEGVQDSAHVSVAPAYAGDVVTLESEPGEPVHLFTPSFGGVHLQITTLTVGGDTIPGVTLRYAERDGLSLLSVDPEDDDLLPDLMWNQPTSFGREAAAPLSGLRRPGEEEAGEALRWQDVRLFPRPVEAGSAYLVDGLELLYTFQWALGSTGGPCRTPEELADSIRGLLDAGIQEGSSRRTALTTGIDFLAGVPVGPTRLLNPALSDPATGPYLDSAWIAALDLGDWGRALISVEELPADATGGEPWTLVALDEGDDFCNGLVPSRLESLREEPLEGPPDGTGQLSFQVLNDFGEGVEDVTLTFEITAGGGTVEPDTRQTRFDGTTFPVRWTLGPDETRQTMLVRAVDPGGQPLDLDGAPLELSFVAQAGPPWEALAAGSGRCAIRSAGELWCWGAVIDAFNTASRVELGFAAAAVSAGGPICVLSDAGAAFCRGNPGTFDPVAGGHTFRSISAGGGHICGVTDTDRALCWGSNHAGQLADGTTQDRTAPVQVLGGLSFAEVSAGSDHTCGVATDGRGFCWGRADRLGAGPDTALFRTEPREVAGGVQWQTIEAGSFHTCGLTLTGEAFCWGWERDGALGNGAATDQQRLEPVAVAGGRVYSGISTGSLATCAVDPAGEGWCWGDGDRGVLGNGSTGVQTVPTAVAGNAVFRTIAVGSCGLTESGDILCWGRGSPEDVLVPEPLRESW